MATVAGTIKSLSDGIFHVKDEAGNIKVLKVGDTIFENDTIYGDSSNASTSKIEIELSGNDVIVLSEGQKQLIDASLIETAFGTEELYFTRDALNQNLEAYSAQEDVVSDLRDAEFTDETLEVVTENAEGENQNGNAEEDATEEETAEGEEEAEDETTGEAQFQARDGDATNVESDLRDATFRARTQTFIDRELFTNESEDRLGFDNTDRSNPFTPTNPTDPDRPTSELRPGEETTPEETDPTPTEPATPSKVIANLSIDDVSAYESEGFLIFTVSLDTEVSSDVTFTYTTSGITATGNKDYDESTGIITIPEGSTSVTIQIPIADDYISDNGETMKVTLSNVEGDAEVVKPEGIGTILDNPVNNPENGTTNTPTEPGGYGEEDTVYAIITGAKIVNEGNTSTYTVELVDKDGNPVIVSENTDVTVIYTNRTTQNSDTEYDNNDTITVTIPANGSSNTFTVVSTDDYISDNGENYNVAIEKVDTNEFENVVIGDKNGNNKDVTTTILDNSNPTDKNTPHNPNNTEDHNQESDKEIVSIKLFAADSNGNVLKDANGNYLLANEVYEGENANYIAYAFEEGENSFNDSTRLDIQTGTINISFQNGTATGTNVDFDSTAQTKITIGEAFDTATIVDSLAEGSENYTVTIDDNSYSGNYESVEIDTNPVTTTLKDAKLFVKIEPVDNEANESENLIYKISIVNSAGVPVEVPTGKELKVNLVYDGNTSSPATQGVDYTSTAQVTITAGNSETLLTLPTVDDYYAEGDEGLKITIDSIDNSSNAFDEIYTHTQANGAPSDEITTTGTIKDNPSKTKQPTDENNTDEPTNGSYDEDDTIYAIIEGPASVNEGDTTTNYTIKLVDKNGNEVKVTKETDVTVTFTNNTTEDGDTEYNNNDTITITIPVGESSNTFTVDTIDDKYQDNAEVYNLEITDVENTGEFENVKIGDKNGNYKDVDTTIYDNTIPGTETDVDPVKIVLVAVATATTTIADITDTDGKLIIDNTNSTPETGKLYYMAVAVDSDGKPLSVQDGNVTLDVSNGSAVGGTSTNPLKDGSEDYDSSLDTTTVNIGNVFEIQTNDDYLAEGDENFTVKITDQSGTSYESPSIDTNNDTVTSTIQDNPAKTKQPTDENNTDEPTNGSYDEDDTVYVKIIDNASVIEGNDLVHHIQLVDKDGNVVTIPTGETITLTLTYNTTTGTITNGDFENGSNQYAENSTITVTLDENTPKDSNGIYKLPITNETIDDFVAEGDEVYTLTITDVNQSGAFENIAIDTNNDSVTGTIKDGITLGTPVNAEVDEDNFDVTDDNTTITDTKSLGIQKPNNPDDNYTLSFDETITVYKGDEDSTETNIYGDNSALKSGGEVIKYKVDGDTITAYTGDESSYTSNKVFEIVLNKDSDIDSGATTKDSYTYTQYKNIDHPISGDSADSTNDDDLTFEFGFKITDQGQTSDTVNFKVKVNDSLPINANRDVEVNEDNSLNIVISPESFKDGEIQIRVNGDGTTYTTLANGETIRVTDPNDDSIEIGTLTNNGDGTVTFEPDEDYSNYNAKPWFEYAVSDFDGDTAAGRVNIDVKPVADAPTITVDDVTSYEDASTYNILSTGNDAEGENKIPLGLNVPELSKDQTDENASGKTGDNPERNGEITLTFINGDKVTGAKIFNGSTEVATINSENQTLKVVIVTEIGGDASKIDYTYHHKGTLPAEGTNVLYLTKGEYESLQIQHAEDNDADIKIGISVTSYELDDNDKPLDTATYGSQVENETTADMTVKINPVTDKFTLNWDGTNNAQVSTVDTGTKTVVFNDIVENNSNPQSGTVSETSLDLKALLTATSGTSNVGNTDSTFDLDGSEERSYTISLTPESGATLPEFIYITIGSKTDVKVYNDGSGNYSVNFDKNDNKVEDPDFSMKFPDYWSGKVTGTITLTSVDKGVDSTDTAGNQESDSVNFEVTVTPVANLATIKVEQSVGFEDAGRSNGNSSDSPSDTIDDIANAIPLNIKVSSDDKDGSEIFNVKISDIPNGAKIYYGGAEQSISSDEITINNFDNDTSLVIVPPYNDDRDFTLKVKVQTEDDGNQTGWTEKDIDVIVKNVADAPKGTKLEDTITVDEANQLNLQDIYADSTALDALDSTEELTIRIDNLTSGFSIANGSPYYIEDGQYVVKASDIKAGNIKINVPEDFSGDASFDLTYVTTEKEGEGDSKTHNTQTVNFFVEPLADDVSVATSSTIYEDADGNANKINIAPSLTDTDGNGVEEITAVKIKADGVPNGYKLYSDASMTQELTTNGTHYELTQTQWENGIYAKNTTTHDADSSDNFDLTVTYTVKDTNGSKTDTKDFTHTHTVNVQAVTDAPSLSVDSITQNSGDVSITGSIVTVNQDNSKFTVAVTTSSADQDSSETVQKIVISGVPMGVSIEDATYYGYSGSEHNGIWVITAPTDSTLDGNGALESIKFIVNQGANFEDRDITITTYTKDIDAEVKSASQTITIKKDYIPGTEPGNPAVLELAVKQADIQEDTEFTLADVLEVNEITAGDANGKTIITFTDIAEGTTVSGHDYEYVEGGKTYYVVVGNGNAADMNAELSNVKITTPKDVNSSQEGTLKGDFTFTADIVTHHNGGFNNGNQVNSTQNIAPVTDEMNINVTAENIDEDGTSNLSITLSNPSDGSKTELIGNSITIKVTETWADVATGGGTSGTLIDSSGKYNVHDNGDGTYTITPKNVVDNFTVGEEITGLQYTPAENRDGSVKFDVSVKNKETGSILELDSTGSQTITVSPVIDVELNASVVTATGTEDIAQEGLANPVKLEITAGTFEDSSETIGNIILDEVPNNFTVWYMNNGSLVMATNIGTTTGTDFDLTPNISGDADVHRNKWLIPASADGSMPEVYINAPEHWSGEFDFKAKFTVSEENLATTKPFEVNVTGKIEAVADDITIAPTMTFGDAFSWIDLNLNANMKDVDGSETMSLEIGGLNESAQFRLEDGTALNATLDGTTWKLDGIAFDQINNIQLAHDESVSSVTVKAKTVEIENSNESSEVTNSFELKLSDISGNFKLDAGMSLNFDSIDAITTAKNLSEIDLSEAGANDLLNLSLNDVIAMTDSSNELKISGTNEDEVQLKGNWTKGSVEAGFDVYTNSDDSSVKVKVQTEISDGITS